MSNTISIVEYQPSYQPYFERFNKAWLNKYYTVEPLDEYVLSKPEEAILQHGGAILFAQYNDIIIGTVGLKRVDDHTMELTKMAVDEQYRGLGAGNLLCKAAISKARALQVKKLILYSQKQLENALGIYRKYGFQDIPVTPGVYKRADVMMELYL